MSGSSNLQSRTGFAALAAAIVVLIAGARSARAAASARLFYGKSSAVQGCADETELRRAIAMRVGYDPIFPMAPNSVSVSITREGEQLVAEVKLANREGVLVGSRTLKAAASQCSELTDTIALTVAIALDTNDRLTPSDPSPNSQTSGSPDASADRASLPAAAASAGPLPAGGPVPPFVAPIATESAPEAPPPTSASSAASPRVEMGAGLTAGLGISPAASLGAAGSAAVRWSRFSLGVEAWLELPASAAASGIPGAKVRTSLAGAGPTGCLHYGDFFGCALAIVGSLHAEAPGVSGASSGSAFDVLGGLRAGVALPLTDVLSVRLSLDLLADPTQTAVRASGRPVWQASLLAAASQIALTLRIP